MDGARSDLAGRCDRAGRPDPAALRPARSWCSMMARNFPAAYRGDAFVALHGSWNRSQRTGYKVVRLLLQDGHPTGAYEDFLTGFVASDEAVWARPVGLTVMHDGSLLVSEDANGTIWRIAYRASAMSATFGVGPLHPHHAGDRRAGLRPGGADRALAGAEAFGPDSIGRLGMGRVAADGVRADAVRLCPDSGRPERPVRPPSGAAAVAQWHLRQLPAAGLGAVTDVAVPRAADRRGDGGECGDRDGLHRRCDAAGRNAPGSSGWWARCSAWASSLARRSAACWVPMACACRSCAARALAGCNVLYGLFVLAGKPAAGAPPRLRLAARQPAGVAARGDGEPQPRAPGDRLGLHLVRAGRAAEHLRARQPGQVWLGHPA